MNQLLLISAVLIASTHAFPTVVTNTTCFHSVDSEDHKCFEACADEHFATKGITDAGTCPSSFDTVDKTATVYQCPDGVTNVRYCASTALNVTIATKGEARFVMEAPLMDCPGSEAWGPHASAKITSVFTDSCAAVMAEVSARAKGSLDGTWSDPHNMGKYTVTSSSASQMKLSHLTGNKQYTDKLVLTFSSSANSGCTVQSCSESQVTSVLDYSTNYCNVHDLTCMDTQCHPINKLSSPAETINSVSSGQHSTSDCYKV